MKRKTIFRVVKILLLVYAVIGIALYYLQDTIFFHPKVLPESHQFKFPGKYKELNIPYSSTSVMNVVQFFPASASIPVIDSVNTRPSFADDSSILKKNGSKGVVLYFHGNRENIEHYASVAPLFTKNGYEIWMLDYPGFGKSTGKFTEQMLYDWALVFYKLARARYAPNEIIIYGKSLGSGIATQLASIRDCRYLLLEAPYYSFPSLVDNYLPVYPTDRLIHFKIPSWQFMQKVTAPVVIFHGTDDWTIPIRNAKRLIPFLKTGDEFVAVDGGKHNNLTAYPVVKSKLDSLLSNSSRQ